MKINEKLIWDYTFTEEERRGEYFRRWYLGRLLTRGGIRDLQDVGLETIHRYLPLLNLPSKIRSFWEWFFALPDIQSRYGHLNPPPKALHP